MNPAVDCLSWVWVLQSAAAVIKTRKAARLFANHRRWLDGGVNVQRRRVALIIAVKGVSDHFDRFMDFVLGQDHPDYHVIFAIESADDPAHDAILRRIAGSDKVRLVVAGMAEHTGQKVHNQLAAFKLLEKADRIVAFADGDLHGRKDWLSCLTLPLEQSQADCTSGYRWFVPESPSLPNRIITLLGTAVEPLIGPNWRMCLWGGSMAVTREVFDELDVPKELQGCVSDDGRISELAHRARKRMRYVRSVAAPSPVDFTSSSLLEFGRRQYFMLRLHRPLLWWMAFFIPLMAVASFGTCLGRLAMGDAWMTLPVAAGILLNLYRTRIRRIYLQSRFTGDEADALDHAVKGSWWLDPLVNLVHFAMIVSSAGVRTIEWAGIRYRIAGPQKTEILSRRDQ